MSSGAKKLFNVFPDSGKKYRGRKRNLPTMGCKGQCLQSENYHGKKAIINYPHKK